MIKSNIKIWGPIKIKYIGSIKDIMKQNLEV